MSDKAGRKSSRRITVGSAVLSDVAMAVVIVLGFIVGSGVALAVEYASLIGAAHAWRSLPGPSGETVLSISPGRPGTLVAETEDGDHFALPLPEIHFTELGQSGDQWHLLKGRGPRIYDAVLGGCRRADPNEKGGWRVRMPRGAIHHTVCPGGDEYWPGLRLHFVLSPDNRVWYWYWYEEQYEQGQFRPLRAYTVPGGIIGAVLGIVAVVVYRARHRRSP